MTDAQDRAEYEQYLRETGQLPQQGAAPTALEEAQSYLQPPEVVTGAMNNALAALIPGSGLAKWLGGKLGAGGAKALTGAPRVAAQVAKTAVPIVEDGAISAAMSPGDRSEAFAKGAGASALMRGGGSVIGKAGDYLAQKAAGIRETRPGRGNALMDQGLFGTSGMQQAQVARKIPERGAELDAVVAGIKDPVSALNSVQALRDAAKKLEINGVVPSNQTALHKQYTDLADSLQSMTKGESMAISAPDYQKFKQAQGEVAYNANGKMPDTNVAAAAGLANKEAANDIAGAWTAANPVGMPPPPRSYRTGPTPPAAAPVATNAYRDKNAELAALFSAKRGLERKPGIGDLAATAAMGAVGYGADGPGGAIGAMMLRAPATKSIGAWSARGGSKALGTAASPVARTVTATPADPEREEYEQYLRETGQAR